MIAPPTAYCTVSSFKVIPLTVTMTFYGIRSNSLRSIMTPLSTLAAIQSPIRGPVAFYMKSETVTLRGLVYERAGRRS